MSRSIRKAIVKDKGDKDYNKRFRRVTKQEVKQLPLNPDKQISDMKEIVNDWDIHDWIIDYEHILTDFQKDKIKNRRK